jgi:hypothetical protein
VRQDAVASFESPAVVDQIREHLNGIYHVLGIVKTHCDDRPLCVATQTKVDPIVQTKSGAEIVKVVSGLTGAVASSEAAAPPRET